MSPLDIRQRAIALLDQLPQTKLSAVVQLLEVLAEPAPQARRATNLGRSCALEDRAGSHHGCIDMPPLPPNIRYSDFSKLS